MLPLQVEADWRKLILANYVVEPALLQPFVPFGTELDYWNNQCYVSLVGFLFLNSKLTGLPIPFHACFEEVNLRFYVLRKEATGDRRGVVFFRELVPKPAVTFVANQFFHEHYQTVPMTHDWIQKEEHQDIRYAWKNKSWHSLAMESGLQGQPLTPGSKEDFFTEHYWGYTQVTAGSTLEYFVDHDPWLVYPTLSFSIAVDFGLNYGEGFTFLNHQQPESVFLAEGSAICLKRHRRIT